MADKYTYATGRRKTAVATVRLFNGGGVNTVNEKPITEMFIHDSYKSVVNVPFKVAGLNPEDFHFTAKVKGSGSVAQMEAIKLAISKSLVAVNPELRKTLKIAGLLTRDPRMVERKKPGLLKARKAEQYSKR